MGALGDGVLAHRVDHEVERLIGLHELLDERAGVEPVGVALSPSSIAEHLRAKAGRRWTRPRTGAGR